MTNELEDVQEVVDGSVDQDTQLDAQDTAQDTAQVDDSGYAHPIDDDPQGTPAGDDGQDDAGDDGEAAETPEFAPELLNAAGLSAEEAAAQFGTPDRLTAAVRMLDSRFMQAGQQYLQSQQYAGGQQQQQRQQYQGQPQQLVTPDGDDAFEMPKPTEQEDWSDDTKNLVKAIHEQFKQRLSTRDQEIQKQNHILVALLEQQQAIERQTYVNEFDSFVGSLGEDWKSVFGSGSGYDMPKNGLAFQNRLALDNAASVLAAGRQALGQPDVPRRELLFRALQQTFSDVKEQVVKKQITSDVSKRQKMVTARPTQRRSRQLTGDEKAIRRVNKFYSEHSESLDQEHTLDSI